MQSVSVYSRVSVARGLAINLTSDCCRRSTLCASSLINSNRLFARLFTNFKYLTHSLALTTDAQQRQPIYTLANSTAKTNSAFVFSNKLATSPLHLVTAYSGYSKEFISAGNKAASAKASSMQFLSRKKGMIGDDAWFIASKNSADVLGVADGVGGWRDIGVDPSKFSTNLMRTCKRIVEQGMMSGESGSMSSDQDTERLKTPIEILTASYQALLENKNQALIGSSTACIIVFNRDSNYLHTANLGDSGFVVVRSNKIVHRSRVSGWF